MLSLGVKGRLFPFGVVAKLAVGIDGLLTTALEKEEGGPPPPLVITLWTGTGASTPGARSPAADEDASVPSDGL